MGQMHIGAALLHELEEFPTFTLDLVSVLADADARSAEEAAVRRVANARRNAPCILYWPRCDNWWRHADSKLRALVTDAIRDLPFDLPVLVVATAETPLHMLPAGLAALFASSTSALRDAGGPCRGAAAGGGGSGVHFSFDSSVAVAVPVPPSEARMAFFAWARDAVMAPAKDPRVVSSNARKRKRAAPLPRAMESLPVAAPRAAPAKPISRRQRAKEEHALRELRIFFREVLNVLCKERRYSCFASPIDAEEVPDYYDIITRPMDLFTMRENVDAHRYNSWDEFMLDLKQIENNAREYNPASTRDARGRNIVHAAVAMQDTAASMQHRFLSSIKYDLIGKCAKIAAARRQRNEATATVHEGHKYIGKKVARVFDNFGKVFGRVTRYLPPGLDTDADPALPVK